MRVKLMLVICFFLFSSVSLFAYIDPNMGSYAVQILIAGVLAFGFIVKTQWRRVIAFLKNKRKGKGAARNDARG